MIPWCVGIGLQALFPLELAGVAMVVAVLTVKMEQNLIVNGKWVFAQKMFPIRPSTKFCGFVTLAQLTLLNLYYQ